MKNKDLPMFPVTVSKTENGAFTQSTIGGNTKFENAVITIAQGLAMSGVIAIDEIGNLSIKIANDLFEGFESEGK